MLTTSDKERIEDVLRKTFLTGKLPLLEEKIQKLRLTHPSEIPDNVIVMDTVASIYDHSEDQTFDVKLVYQLQILQNHQVSILSPLGTALLGGRVDQEIDFIQRDGKMRKISIKAIVSRPSSEEIIQ